MITLFNKKKNCCGCGSCENICPKNAISMGEDEYGFIYPKIDHNLCIECHLCEKVCNFQSRTEYSDEHKAYAAVTKNQEILMNSTSGGIFTTIALEFIKDGGYVAGSIYDENFNVVHIVSNKIEDIYKMQGSKYVQSSINDTYSQIRKLLSHKEKVLFSGTPCQVDGLYGYLQSDYDNLYTIDIVCHGVPSNKMFQDYLNFESKNNGQIRSITFRDKTQGWQKDGKIVFYNKEKKINAGSSEYYYLFNNNLIFRDSCYSCKYSSLKRPGDLTIGDYWGIEIVDAHLMEKKGMNSKKGISLIISNNDHGRLLIKHYQKSLYIYTTEIKNIIKYNHNLKKTSQRPSSRYIVLNKYSESFENVTEYISKNLRKEKLKIRIKNIIPEQLKVLLKKYLTKV